MVVAIEEEVLHPQNLEYAPDHTVSDLHVDDGQDDGRVDKLDYPHFRERRAQLICHSMMPFEL